MMADVDVVAGIGTVTAGWIGGSGTRCIWSVDGVKATGFGGADGGTDVSVCGRAGKTIWGGACGTEAWGVAGSCQVVGAGAAGIGWAATGAAGGGSAGMV